MEINEAIRLIEPALPVNISHSRWADLGCGNGTFTIALSHLLGEGSIVYAIDKQSQTIHSPTAVEIEFIKRDFITGKLPISNLNGIIMANSLHYVKDQIAFVEKVKHPLRFDGQLIVVEYDTDMSNQWVPYPLSFGKLKNLFSNCGFNFIEKVGEYNSIYHGNKMYACVIRF